MDPIVAKVIKEFENMTPEQRDQTIEQLVKRISSNLWNAIDWLNEPEMAVAQPNFATGLVAVAWAGINHLDEVEAVEEVNVVNELWRISES